MAVELANDAVAPSPIAKLLAPVALTLVPNAALRSPEATALLAKPPTPTATAFVPLAEPCPLLERQVELLAVGTVFVANRGRACANQNSDIGDRDTLCVHENEIGGSEVQRLENDGAVGLLVNIDDKGIAD
jgi:hypothetical protein